MNKNNFLVLNVLYIEGTLNVNGSDKNIYIYFIYFCLTINKLLFTGHFVQNTHGFNDCIS